MSHSDEAAPLLPGLKPVLELLSSDPQRIDCIFCKKGLRGPEAQAIQALCRERGVPWTGFAVLARPEPAAGAGGRPWPIRGWWPGWPPPASVS